MFGDPDDFTPLMRRLRRRDTRARERDAVRWHAAERLRGRPLVSWEATKGALVSFLIAAAIVGFCAWRW